MHGVSTGPGTGERPGHWPPRVKSLLRGTLRFLARTFYRRVETAGLEHVPAEGPVLFAANHFNGLVDPMLVLLAVNRPVVFVAKSTLWKIPVLRGMLNSLGVVPVVRRVDAAEETRAAVSQNDESLRRLADVLAHGGAVLIFPEGRSHSDPALSPLRTGAARILLLAGVPAAVVPFGLWYTRKEEFRSDVLLRAGAPLAAPREPTVEGWTEAIRAGLESVTLNAGDWEDHEIVAAVESLYGERLEVATGRVAETGSTGKGTTGGFLESEERDSLLDRSFRNRQLLLAARRPLDRIEPKAVASVASRARALDHFLRKIGLSPAALDSPPPLATILAHTLRALLVVVLGFPVALLGVVTWWVPYRLCGSVANRLPGAAENRDQISLYKLLGGIVFFPVTLGLWTLLAEFLGGPWAALATVAVLPPAGLFTLRYLEHAEVRERQARDLLAVAFVPGGVARLRAERDALRAECDRLAEVYRAAP
jgi:glycerol-3-phosphate O-acyltransferase / dihydroxyacetone phosphate acyltransferase